MNEVNNINDTENVVLVNPPTTAYEVAQNTHTVLVVLTLFIMAFCMYKFLRSIIRK